MLLVLWISWIKSCPDFFHSLIQVQGVWAQLVEKVG